MHVAILGAGNVGRSLAVAAAGAGHSVVVSAASTASAQRAADESGSRTASSNAEAAQGADLIVLAIPHAAVEQVAAEISGTAGIVVDATNPLNATFTDLTTTGTSAAEDLQKLLQDGQVVKAFNTVLAARLGAPSEDGAALDAYLAGNDAASKSRVAEFVSSLAFRPIDVGDLRMARALEEMAFLNITMNARNGWPWQSAWKLVGPSTQTR